MNNRGRLVVDLLLAVLAAILVLVLSPGLGVVAILIGLVLVISLISFAVGAAIRYWRGQPVRADVTEARPRRPPVQPDSRQPPPR